MVVTHQVYGFSCDFRGVIAPGLTPQPLLWERLDGHLVDHVVGEVLKRDGKLRNPLAPFNKRILYLCRVTWSRLDRLFGSWLRA